MELQTFVDRLKRVYETSPDPSKDISASGIMETARLIWDNADEIRTAVERRMFESIGKRRIFHDYLIYSINSIFEGIDNGFRCGTYIDFKFKPYMDSYVEHAETYTMKGWNIRAMPINDIVLDGDIMAHQAVWEFRNSVQYDNMRPGEWNIETTFIYGLYDKDEYSTRTPERIGQLIEQHYTIDGCWHRLIEKDRVWPELSCLFESISNAPKVNDKKADARRILPPDF